MFSDMNSFFDNEAVRQAEVGNGLYTLSPSVPNVLELFYKNLEKCGYNLTELRPALEQEGTSLIISCAGSGKTTFMEMKLIRDYLKGELTDKSKVLISTFLKTGVEELKNSFDERCSELNVTGIYADSFSFSTLHAEYYSILSSIGINIQIIQEEQARDALKATCKSLNIRNRARGFGELTKDELADVECVVTYARNRLDNMRYKHPVAEDYGLTNALLDKLIDLYRKHRVAINSYDFEDLQDLVYQGIITNPKFMQYVMSRYDYVFIDEFQDTSQIQYEILKAYINGARKAVVIGDDDQCIYSWRGSDVNIITTRFVEDYHPAIHKFTVNYRCGANILAPVVPSIKLNSNRHEKDLNAYRAGGTVLIHQTCDVDKVLEDVRDALTKQHNVGILSRTNFDLLAPAILLELDGSVPFSVSKSVGISSYIPKVVFGCIKLLTRRYTEDFEYLLKQFCGYTWQREATVIADVLRVQSELSLNTLDKEDLAYSCPNLYNTIIAPMRAASTQVDAYITLLRALSSIRFKGDSLFAAKGRNFINFVVDLISNHSVLKSLTLSDIDELFTDIIPVRLTKRAYNKDKEKYPVRLTTVHEAKGKEWSTVILWNDIDGVFPARVGNHSITASEYEEERRLHYIAFTRAKDMLIVYTSEAYMSPFLKECDLTASMSATITDNPLETPVLQTKEVTVQRDTFYTLLADCINGHGTAELQSYVSNLVEYYDYDTPKLLDELHKKHQNLRDKGILSAISGDIFTEFEMTVEYTVLSIMQTTKDSAATAV